MCYGNDAQRVHYIEGFNVGLSKRNESEGDEKLLFKSRKKKFFLEGKEKREQGNINFLKMLNAKCRKIAKVITIQNV